MIKSFSNISFEKSFSYYYFIMLEIIFLIHRFLMILEKHFLKVRNEFLVFKQLVLFSYIRNAFSNIRN